MNKLIAASAYILSSSSISALRLNSILYLCDTLCFKANGYSLTGKSWFYSHGLKDDISDVLWRTSFFELSSSSDAPKREYLCLSPNLSYYSVISCLTNDDIAIINLILKQTESFNFNQLNSMVLSTNAFSKSEIYQELDLSFS